MSAPAKVCTPSATAGRRVVGTGARSAPRTASVDARRSHEPQQLVQVRQGRAGRLGRQGRGRASHAPSPTGSWSGWSNSRHPLLTGCVATPRTSAAAGSRRSDLAHASQTPWWTRRRSAGRPCPPSRAPVGGGGSFDVRAAAGAAAAGVRGGRGAPRSRRAPAAAWWSHLAIDRSGGARPGSPSVCRCAHPRARRVLDAGQC
jgi:hypothetical protein